MSIQNYHKHSHYTNIIIADSVTTNEEYALRAKQLDSKIIASTEHAYQGNYYEAYELAKKHSLKFIFGSEIYWVLDKKSEDKSNCHMVLLARSEKGRRAINKALSIANKDGYYYRPRLDLELIFTLPPDDVFITTACIAYWQYENIEDLTRQYSNHFKSNFNLEIQYHASQKQIVLNQKIKELSSKYNIPLIVGLDSHYILEEEKQKRLDYLEGRGIVYKDTDESEFFMDYPDDETIIKRFQKQGIFTNEEIQQAINRTNELLTFDNISFDSSTKMVSLYPNKTQDEKNQLYKSIINREFKKYAKENALTKEEINTVYKQGIQLEADTVIETGMTDYFLLDYEIVKRGIEKGGVITPTGRGSGVSYFTNTLLGFSKIDRFKAPIHLYPERFMSKSRILETRSLPDLDLNLGNPEVFAEAQRELLGENHAYPMIAYGKMKKKSAFKMYARATNVPFDEANEIGKQIEKYELALKYADDEDKDLIDIYEYVDKKYEHHIENSKQYEKIVTSKSSHPCAYLLYQGEIDEEIGLIRCKSETTGKDTVVTVIDGLVAEKYGFLKNDLLKVDVVMLNHVIAQRIGMATPSFVQLLKLIANDGGKTWTLYEIGATACINQVAKKSTTDKVQRYKPKSDGELACFVAAIRPSFKSLYKQYENREHFEYGIPSLDYILQTEQIQESFIFFQEQMMAIMNYAGIPMDQTYDIIKNISKKRPEKVLKYKEIFLQGFAKILVQNENRTSEQANELSMTIWKIVEDFCAYGFNASHAYCVAADSLYGAYLKANHTLEFYEASLNYYTEKKKKEKVSELINEAKIIYGINFNQIQYGHDNTKFIINGDQSINYALPTIKFCSSKIAKELFKFSKSNKTTSFLEVIHGISGIVNSRQLEILILLDYFREYGKAKKLQKFVELFLFFSERKQFSKSEEYPIKFEIIKQFCKKETDKTISDFDFVDFINYVWNHLSDKDLSLKERIMAEYEYMGYINSVGDSTKENFYLVTEVSNKYKNYMIERQNLNTGEIDRIKVKKRTFDDVPIVEKDIIEVKEEVEDFKWYKDDNGKWQQKDEKEKILTIYRIIN